MVTIDLHSALTDTHFKCHTRGCKGGRIDLIMALATTDITGAIAYLARRKGVTLPDRFRLNRSSRIQTMTFATPKELEENSEKARLRRRLRTVHSFIVHWSNRLKDLRERKRLRLIEGCDYYTQLHVAEHHLDALDTEASELNYHIKRIA